MFTVVITWISSLYFTKIILVQMSFKVHFRWGNLDLCSGVIAVPIGPNSHTFTVILAVFAPQPRWPRKPWKGPLIIYAIQQWKKNQSAIIHWPLFTFTWLLTKSTGSSSSPPRTEWNFWGFSKTHKFSSCYFSSFIQSSNATNKSPKRQFLNNTTQVL